MSAEEVFLREIREHPDDDAPRLIYADWLEENGPPGSADRAAFIRVQCRLAALPADDDNRSELERQERLLRLAHGGRWLGQLGSQVHRATFRRGFVERIEVAAQTFLDRAGEWLDREPIRHALLLDVDRDLYPSLATCPALGRLEGLRLQSPRNTAGMPAVGYPLSDEAVRILVESRHLTGLRSLDLTGNHLYHSGVEALASSPSLGRLEHLMLVGTQLDAAGVGVLAASSALAGLTSLDLGDNNFVVGGIEDLAWATGLPSLQELRLVRSGLGDAALTVLAASSLLARLSALDLSVAAYANQDVGAGLQALAGSPGLRAVRSLTVRGSAVHWPSLATLLQAPRAAGLTLLDLSSNRAGDFLGTLLRGVPHLEGLTTLRLADSTLRSSGVESLVQLLHPRSLRVLDLGRNGIDARGGQALASWAELASLTALELAENGLGPEGARALSLSPHLARLRLLDLGHNSIGPAGARALAESPHLGRLTELRLNWNDLGDEGTAVLAASPSLRCLGVLNLKGNRIGDAGACALAASPHLGALERLELHGNRIGAPGRRAIRERFGTRVCSGL